MKKPVTIPRLGSSDESDEVRVLRWLKADGAAVRKGEALLEVETDKVNVEIESPDDFEAVRAAIVLALATDRSIVSS